MTSQAFRPNILIEVNLAASGASPEQYITMPEGTDIIIGESTPLIDVTHYQSTGREYIGGLPDGEEFSMACNRIHGSPDYQESLMALKGLTRTMRVTETNPSVSPNTSRIFTFDVVVLGYSLNPPVGEKGDISFNFKISGGITRT